MSALSNRDTNVQPTSNPFENETNVASGEDNKPQNIAKSIFGKQVGEENGDGKTYVSPSDAIMSPASQKLAGFKQRHINKQNGNDATRRSLFAKTTSVESEKGPV